MDSPLQRGARVYIDSVLVTFVRPLGAGQAVVELGGSNLVVPLSSLSISE